MSKFDVTNNALKQFAENDTLKPNMEPGRDFFYLCRPINRQTCMHAGFDVK